MDAGPAKRPEAQPEALGSHGMPDSEAQEYCTYARAAEVLHFLPRDSKYPKISPFYIPGAKVGTMSLGQ